ncbi:MAG: hypothetical protein NZ908_02720, partial [Candidatus Micrarchaeota archaeon]|nr:hypothetical protein [Candidatus Micrarchaeota archaeon]
ELFIDRDSDMNLKILDIMFKFRAVKELETDQKYLAIVLDTNIARSTLDPNKPANGILIIDHHESKDYEQLSSPQDTIFEMFVIKHRCVSNGFLLYRILESTERFRNSPETHNLIRYLAAVSLEGDTIRGKIAKHEYVQAINYLSISETDKKKVEEIYETLRNLFKNNTNFELVEKKHGIITGLVRDDSDPGYAANQLFEETDGKMLVVVIKRQGERIRFSIRFPTPLSNRSKDRLMKEIKSLGDTSMGFSNSQVLGGHVETNSSEQLFLDNLSKILSELTQK